MSKERRGGGQEAFQLEQRSGRSNEKGLVLMCAGPPQKSIALAAYDVLKACVCRLLFVGEPNHHDYHPSRTLRLSKGGRGLTDHRQGSC